VGLIPRFALKSGFSDAVGRLRAINRWRTEKAGGTMKARLIRLTTIVASLTALAAVLGAGQKWR
jgi:hypothetical protein